MAAEIIIGIRINTLTISQIITEHGYSFDGIEAIV